ncbi:hypothetical protein K502DRAFT_323320 [Neoconidiobolus thromboides FSU 785]|nr:hypothetical protein K502DRAFT_323320 [Neoconidiobolus thromboides FSU 785]
MSIINNSIQNKTPAPIGYDIVSYSLKFKKEKHNAYYAPTPNPSRNATPTENGILPPMNFNNYTPDTASLPSLSEVIKHINSYNTSRTRSEISSSELTTPKDGCSSTFEDSMHTKSDRLIINQVNSTFSTVAGFHQKRPRRLYSEVKRIYKCEHPGCTKAYGALNHLNSHILNQNHGQKRKACEFYHLTRP